MPPIAFVSAYSCRYDSCGSEGISASVRPSTSDPSNLRHVPWTCLASLATGLPLHRTAPAAGAARSHPLGIRFAGGGHLCASPSAAARATTRPHLSYISLGSLSDLSQLSLGYLSAISRLSLGHLSTVLMATTT